jgi:hypothetical protein
MTQPRQAAALPENTTSQRDISIHPFMILTANREGVDAFIRIGFSINPQAVRSKTGRRTGPG